MEQKIVPYEEASECPKCGCENVRMAFDQIECGASEHNSEVTTDVLVRHCGRCGHKWHTRCKDYEEAQGVPMEDRWVRLEEVHPGALYVRVISVDDPGTKVYKAYYDTYDGERLATSEG